MDTTERDIRSLFANTGELDRDEIALLLLQLVERIQNLENAQQRTWVGLSNEQFAEACRLAENGNYLVAFQRIQHWIKENNT
jgi:hypothetical protein